MVEMIVGAVILAMFLGMLIWAIFFFRSPKKVSQQLDVFHEARLINSRMVTALHFSNGIVFPNPPKSPTSKPQAAHQLLFRDSTNRIQAIFLAPKERLMLLDYASLSGNKLKNARVIGRHVQSFEVTNMADKTIKFALKIYVDKQEYLLENKILPANLV